MIMMMTTTTTMMIISLISYFPFRDQLSLNLSKWLVYTCHSFPLHPSLVLSTIPKQQMTNQRVLHSVWRHFFLRNNQTLANPKSAFSRSFSEKKNRYYCRSYSDRDFEATLEWFTHLGVVCQPWFPLLQLQFRLKLERIFSQHFSREHKREKVEKLKAKYFKATSDHFLTFKVWNFTKTLFWFAYVFGTSPKPFRLDSAFRIILIW